MYALESFKPAYFIVSMGTIETQAESQKFLDSIGLRPFNPPELFEISRAFSRDLLGGLETPKNPGSLKMIETHLRSPSEQFIRSQEGEPYLILEVGGTNVYAAETTIKDGKPVIVEEHGFPVEAKGKLTKIRFEESPDEFFKEFLSHVESIVRRRPYTSMGIIYSFPAEIVDTELGIDVNSQDELPKDFYIKDIHLKPVGMALVEYMRKNGYDMSRMDTIVVENDTAATLLSVPGSKIGGIVGTGYNLAMMVGGKIYNLECGGFKDVPQHTLSRELVEKNGNKEFQLAEKQISGKYLGIQLEKAIEKMNMYGIHLHKRKPKEDLDGTNITYALKGNKENLLRDLEGNLDNRAMTYLKAVAERLKERSYQLLATKISTIIQTFPEEYIENDISAPITIPIEGSVFWGIPYYKLNVQRIIAGETKEAIFPEIKHAGVHGATISILGTQEPWQSR